MGTNKVEFNSQGSATHSTSDTSFQNAPPYEELVQNQEFFTNILESMSDGVLVLDTDFRFKTWNRSMEWISGVTREEVLNSQKLPWEMFPHLIENGVVEIMKRAMAGENTFLQEVPYHTPKGKKGYSDETYLPLRDADGSVTGIVGFIRDVTQRKQTTEALADHAQFERLITNISTDFINLRPEEIDSGINGALQWIGEMAYVDRSYVFSIYENGNKADNTHEWCAAGIQPQKDLLNNINIKKEFPFFTKTMEEFEVFHAPLVSELPPEAAQEKRNFQELEILSLICVPMVSQEKLIGFVGFDAVREPKTWPQQSINLLKVVGQIFVNALERKKAEEAMKAGESLMQAILEGTPDPIFAKDINGRYLLANSAAAKIVNSDRKSMLGKTNSELFNDPKFIEATAAEEEEVLRASTPVVQEHPVDQGGKKKLFQVSKSTYNDHAGNPIGIVGVARDITKLKEVEDALRKSEANWRAIVENAPNMIFTTDLEGRIQFINRTDPPATPEQIIGTKITELVRDNDIKRIQGYADHVGSTGESLGYEIQSPDEYEARWYAVQVGPLQLDEKIVGLTFIAVDITERKLAEEALRQSEEKYRTLVESVPDYIMTVDREANITWTQKVLPGLKIEEVVGSSSLDYIDDADKSKVLDALKIVFETGETVHVEMGAIQDTFWETRYVPIQKDNKIVEAMVIANNVTDSRRAEEALRESEERFRAVVNSATEAMIAVGVDGHVTLFNPAAEKMFGYTEKDLLGRSLDCLMPDEYREAHNRGLKKWMANPSELNPLSSTFEFAGKRKNGDIFPLELSLSSGKFGRQPIAMAVIRDITLRKKSEELLKTQARILESMGEGVNVSDQNGNIFFTNSAFDAMFGYEKGELLGKHVSVLNAYPEDNNEKVVGEVVQQLEEKGIWDGDFQNRKKDGAVFTTHARISTLKVGDSQYWISVQEDITERKLAEEKLISNQKELRSLASKLVLTEERERRTIATTLHDRIGQSLALCKMKLQAMEAESEKEDDAASLKHVRTLLDQAIQDTRSLTFELSPPILYELGLGPAIEWLAERARKQHNLRCTCVRNVERLPLADDVRVVLFQATREILFNVVKHAKADSAKITLEKSEEQVNITVEDNGIGFDPKRISDRAIDTDAFGLFSIRERITQQGGTMQILSKETSGTKIVLSVPLSPDEKLEGIE